MSALANVQTTCAASSSRDCAFILLSPWKSTRMPPSPTPTWDERPSALVMVPSTDTPEPSSLRTAPASEGLGPSMSSPINCVAIWSWLAATHRGSGTTVVALGSRKYSDLRWYEFRNCGRSMMTPDGRSSMRHSPSTLTQLNLASKVPSWAW